MRPPALRDVAVVVAWLAFCGVVVPAGCVATDVGYSWVRHWTEPMRAPVAP